MAQYCILAILNENLHSIKYKLLSYNTDKPIS